MRTFHDDECEYALNYAIVMVNVLLLFVVWGGMYTPTRPMDLGMIAWQEEPKGRCDLFQKVMETTDGTCLFSMDKKHRYKDHPSMFEEVLLLRDNMDCSTKCPPECELVECCWGRLQSKNLVCYENKNAYKFISESLNITVVTWAQPYDYKKMVDVLFDCTKRFMWSAVYFHCTS